MMRTGDCIPQCYIHNLLGDGSLATEGKIVGTPEGVGGSIGLVETGMMPEAIGWPTTEFDPT